MIDYPFLAAHDFGPICREHHPLARSSFVRACSEVEPDPPAARILLHKIIHRVLVDPRACTVAAWPHGYPDEHIGWAVAIDGALVFAYVKKSFRRHGLGTMLVAQVLEPDGPIRVAYWTRAAGRMALGGYPIVHDACAQSELARFAR